MKNENHFVDRDRDKVITNAQWGWLCVAQKDSTFESSKKAVLFPQRRRVRATNRWRWDRINALCAGPRASVGGWQWVNDRHSIPFVCMKHNRCTPWLCCADQITHSAWRWVIRRNGSLSFCHFENETKSRFHFENEEWKSFCHSENAEWKIPGNSHGSNDEVRSKRCSC